MRDTYFREADLLAKENIDTTSVVASCFGCYFDAFSLLPLSLSLWLFTVKRRPRSRVKIKTLPTNL